MVQQFTDIVKRALNQFLNEEINQRLQSAISTTGEMAEDHRMNVKNGPMSQLSEEELESRIETTLEELEGFYIVKSIVREVVAPDRIVHRDRINYMSVLLDDNNRKPICRLRFNRATKYLGIFDEEKNEERVKLESVDDIYNYADQLKATAQSYDIPSLSESSE